MVTKPGDILKYEDRDVQIPLWSMVTLTSASSGNALAVQITLWSMVTQLRAFHDDIEKVQIPLWSMVTAVSGTANEFDSGWLTAKVVVLLAREFGWTIDEMRQLTPRELAVVLNELQRQVALEQYNDQYSHWAFLAAVITNGFGAIAGMFSKRRPKTFSPDDFMGKEAKKMLQRLLGQEELEPKAWSKHIEDAKAKGLRVPIRS